MRSTRGSISLSLALASGLLLTGLAPAVAAPRPPGLLYKCYAPVEYVPGVSWTEPVPKRCPRAIKPPTRLDIPVRVVSPNFDMFFQTTLADQPVFLYVGGRPQHWSQIGDGLLYLQIQDSSFPKGQHRVELYDPDSRLVGWFWIDVQYDW